MPRPLLEKQRRMVKAIFKKLEAGRGGSPPLLRELADSLGAHMARRGPMSLA